MRRCRGGEVCGRGLLCSTMVAFGAGRDNVTDRSATPLPPSPPPAAAAAAALAAALLAAAAVMP